MKLTTLALMALAGMTLANDAEVVCEQSAASPLLHHVNQLIENTAAEDDPGKALCTDHSLEGEARKCEATKKEWSGEGGGAVFQLCKGWNGKQGYRCQAVVMGPPPVGLINSGLSIKEVSGYLAQIRDQCTGTFDNAKRAGGKVVFGGGSAVLKLYSMPG